MRAITTKYEQERNLKKIQPGKLTRKVSPILKRNPQGTICNGHHLESIRREKIK